MPREGIDAEGPSGQTGNGGGSCFSAPGSRSSGAGPDDIYRKILVRAHADVMPHMPSPVTLSDFSSMTERSRRHVGAERHIPHDQAPAGVPKFSDRLYGLLDSSCFRAATGSFFELLDVFLKSPALPAYLAAAFIKRMSRLAIRTLDGCCARAAVTTCCEAPSRRDGAQGKRKVDGIGPFRGGRARPGAEQGARELVWGWSDVQALPRRCPSFPKC